MIVGFTRYSRDQSFTVLARNKTFVLVMAAGSILGSLIGGQLLQFVPAHALLPILAAISHRVSGKGLAASIGISAKGRQRGHFDFSGSIG